MFSLWDLQLGRNKSSFWRDNNIIKGHRWTKILLRATQNQLNGQDNCLRLYHFGKWAYIAESYLKGLSKLLDQARH